MHSLHLAAEACNLLLGNLSLHSLRRGGTQACAAADLCLNAILEAGTWLSRVVFDCLDSSVITKAPSAVAHFLEEY